LLILLYSHSRAFDVANFAQNKQPMGCDAQLVELGKIVTEDVWKGEYSCKKFNYVCMYVCMYIRLKQLTNRNILFLFSLVSHL